MRDGRAQEHIQRGTQSQMLFGQISLQEINAARVEGTEAAPWTRLVVSLRRVGAAVQTYDAGHSFVVVEHIEQVGSERAGTATQEDSHLLGWHRRRCSVGMRETADVCLENGLHAFNGCGVGHLVGGKAFRETVGLAGGLKTGGAIDLCANATLLEDEC